VTRIEKNKTKIYSASADRGISSGKLPAVEMKKEKHEQEEQRSDLEKAPKRKNKGHKQDTNINFSLKFKQDYNRNIKVTVHSRSFNY
jgi:hypothetical protein